MPVTCAAGAVVGVGLLEISVCLTFRFCSGDWAWTPGLWLLEARTLGNDFRWNSGDKIIPSEKRTFPFVDEGFCSSIDLKSFHRYLEASKMEQGI